MEGRKWDIILQGRVSPGKKNSKNFMKFENGESYNPKSCICCNEKHLLCKVNNKVGIDAGSDLI